MDDFSSGVLLRVFMIIQQLLQENKHASKRDIYYMQPSIFKGKLPVRIHDMFAYPSLFLFKPCEQTYNFLSYWWISWIWKITLCLVNVISDQAYGESYLKNFIFQHAQQSIYMIGFLDIRPPNDEYFLKHPPKII